MSAVAARSEAERSRCRLLGPLLALPHLPRSPPVLLRDRDALREHQSMGAIRGSAWC